MKALVAYDGTVQAKTALGYGIEKVRKHSGELVVLHVFNNNLFINYDAIPQAEEIARRESVRYMAEAERIIKEKGGGIKASIIVEDGNPEKEIISYAKTESIDIIFSPPRYKSIVRKSPCPVSVIPGDILIPVDNRDNASLEIEQIITEASATQSRVVLMGIIPIHIYSKWEKEELDQVTRETSAAVRRLGKILTDRAIRTKEIIRSGYPDIEIMKAAEEYTVSMIMFLAGNQQPSELNKAADIILDESERSGSLFYLCQLQGE